MDYKIVPVNKDNMHKANVSTQPFTIFGRLIPSYEDGTWGYTEELFSSQKEYTFPHENLDFSKYIDSNDCQMFFIMEGENIAGHIRIRRNWNKYCYIEDIEVAKAARKKGYGAILMKAAEEWGKEMGLKGVMLEAQDDNLAACRFYLKNGYVLGGVDTMIYHAFENMQRALFFYKLF